MKINVIKRDITKLPQEIEAIVNAANNSLLGGGGVDGAIHKAAGPDLLKECRALGGCDTGDAKVTKAYNLKQKYIIHTVGPIFDIDNNPHEKLRSCYLKCLKLADKLGVKRMAFPSISTGAYHYPVEEASDVAIQAMIEYSKENKNIEEVYICIWGNEIERDLEAYKNAFNLNFDEVTEEGTKKDCRANPLNNSKEDDYEERRHRAELNGLNEEIINKTLELLK